MKCFYCAKRAVRRGLCSRSRMVGHIEVCGRHLACIDRPNENLGIRRA